MGWGHLIMHAGFSIISTHWYCTTPSDYRGDLAWNGPLKFWMTCGFTITRASNCEGLTGCQYHTHRHAGPPVLRTKSHTRKDNEASMVKEKPCSCPTFKLYIMHCNFILLYLRNSLDTGLYITPIVIIPDASLWVVSSHSNIVAI